MVTPGGGTGTAPPPAPSSPPPAAAAAPTPPPPAEPTTGPSAVVSCDTSGLSVTDAGGQGAAGTFLGVMVLRNVTTTRCTLYGYPGLQRLDAQGRPMPTVVVRDPTVPAALVHLGPQQQASFGYSYLESPLDGATTCPRPAGLQVTPPGQRSFAVVRPGGGGFVLYDPTGEVRVRAVIAGVKDYNGSAVQ